MFGNEHLSLQQTLINMTDYKSVALKNFDKGNEPEIRLMSNGDVYLALNFFPPLSFDMTGEDQDRFALEMSQSIGAEVLHEDREFFLIKGPVSEDSVDRLKQFIETYKDRKGYSKTQPPPSNALNQKSVTEFVLSHLENRLKGLGFVAAKKNQWLLRKTDAGHIAVLFGVSNYHPRYSISISFQIRIEEVAQVFNVHYPLDKKYQSGYKTGPTWHIGMDYFRKFDPKTVYPDSFDALAQYCDTACQEIVQNILPQLETLQDPVQLERFCWEQLLQKTQRFLGDTYFSNALILTHLYNNQMLGERIAYIRALMEELNYHPMLKDRVEGVMGSFGR